MASIKVKFRPSAIDGSVGRIYYQVIHERNTRQVSTPYQIYSNEWDNRFARVRNSNKGAERGKTLEDIKERIYRDIKRMERAISKLKSRGIPFYVDEIIDEYKRSNERCSFYGYMEQVIEKLKSKGKLGTAENYVSALNSFKKFRNGMDIHLDEITSDLLERYETYLYQNRHVTSNTASFYMRILRAVYNRAVEDGLIEQCMPFRRVYTGIDKTKKRALTLSSIRKIKNMDLSNHKSLDYARDMFMMSLYLRGMSLIDMAYLRSTDLCRGRVIYRRRKTGQQMMIRWTEEMQEILDKYRRGLSCNGKYLLPIISATSKNERVAYRNAGYNINYNLKKIARMAGIQTPLTLYVARHSWASIAKSKGVPISVISEGMGHESEATTQIYLASLDTSVIDEANSLIIKSIVDV